MMTLLRYYRKNGPSLRMLEEPNSLRKTMSISLTRKVDFPMLDLAGIAYFPRIYDLAHRFFEDAWLEICGVSYPHIINEMKIGFPVVDIQTKFIQPLKYGDENYCKNMDFKCRKQILYLGIQILQPKSGFTMVKSNGQCLCFNVQHGIKGDT